MVVVPPTPCGNRYLMPQWNPPAPPCGTGGAGLLLRVELDDQLLGDLRVDLRTLGQLVDQYAHGRRHDLQPARNRAVAQQLLGDDERIGVQRLRPDIDDVVLRHTEAGDVHLLAVDQEVAVAHQLPGHPPGAGEPGPVDDVVEPRLEDLQEGVARLARTTVGLLVVPAELLLQHAVGEAGLLLLLRLQEVLRLLDPDPAVLAGRVGTALERLVAADEVDLQSAGLAIHGSGVTSHVLLLPFPRPGAAWADGSRCAAAG